MENQVFVQSVIFFIMLLFTASLAAIVLKKIQFSYSIGLVILGIILQRVSLNIPLLEPISKVSLTPNVILYILLPTLIFSAAFTIDSRMLMKNILPVLILSAPGLIISTLATGLIVAWLTPLGLGAAMLFGALISATDPVAVVALFAEIGAPKRLRILVDGESLFNDATAIVAFRIIFGMVASGAAWSISSMIKGSISFCTVFFGGIVVGILIGLIIIKITSWAKKDPLIQIALSTVAAYIAFILADYYLQVSGVMAAMAAGIVLSFFGLTKYSKEAKQYMAQFWDYAAFVGNSFIFLLLGITEASLLTDLGRVSGLLINVAFAALAVTAARAIVVFGLCPLIGKFRRADRIGMPYQTVIFWGGLRGAVPLALAFSLAADFPQRQLIVELTLGIVLFTLLIQGTTIGKLMSLFSLDKQTTQEKFAKANLLLEATGEALDFINESAISDKFNKKVLKECTKKYAAEMQRHTKYLEKIMTSPDFNMQIIQRTVWMKALSISRGIYSSLYENKIISESVFRELELVNSESVDRVLEDETPELNLFPTPLEHKIRQTASKIIIRYFPKSKWAEKLKRRDFQSFFETTSAIIISAEKLDEFFKNLRNSQQIPKSVIDECREFFKKRRKTLVKELIKLSKQHKELFISLQARILDNIVRQMEISHVSEAAKECKVTQSMANAITDELQATS